MRVLLDTNILVRLVNGEEDPLFRPAHSALKKLRQENHILTLVPQVLYEFWVVATRPLANNGLGMTTQEAAQELQCFGPPLFRLLHDERAIFSHWKDLVTTYQVQGKVAHDTRLVAAMLRHNLSQLLTFNDADFRRYREITATTPHVVISS